MGTECGGVRFDRRRFGWILCASIRGNVRGGAQDGRVFITARNHRGQRMRTPLSAVTVVTRPDGAGVLAVL